MIIRLWALTMPQARCEQDSQSKYIVPPHPGEKNWYMHMLSCWEGKTDLFVYEE